MSREVFLRVNTMSKSRCYEIIRNTTSLVICVDRSSFRLKSVMDLRGDMNVEY